MRDTMPRRSKEYARFVQRLRAARERAGLSQSEAARRLGRQQSYVWKCENGVRRVDVIEATALAKLYRVPLTFFVR